jgi:hypothetical protein
MSTHTPIPYWLSMAIEDLFAWASTVGEIEQAERER